MVNQMILQGRFTAEPEVKQVSGFSVVEFTLAWSEKYKESENKCFMRCKAWRNTADFIGKYFHKGDMAVVEGTMLTESWEKDGQTQSRTLCTVEKCHFCGNKSNSTDSDSTKADNGFVNVPEGIPEELPFN